MFEIINYAIKNNCSDIHITEGKVPKVRQRGQIKSIPKLEVITKKEIIKFLNGTMSFEYTDNLDDIDTSFECLDRRIRANIYRGMSGISMALRVLNEKIPTLDNLALPQSISAYTKMVSGLVLVVGSTGSGKSTTLASIINTINNISSLNILTIEDPIEYVYAEGKSRIEQREVGVHTKSFNEAVRSAMRQDPDIILVGELRDLDTISNAITLAETGHLVFATLHAKSVPDTIDRIIDVFPCEGQEQIRVQLSSVLRGVVHQRLVQNLKSGLVPIVEILMVDDVVSGMIKQKQKSNSLRDYLRSQKNLGSVHLADNIVWHVENARIELDTIKNILSADDYNLAKSILLARNKRTGFGGV